MNRIFLGMAVIAAGCADGSRSNPGTADLVIAARDMSNGTPADVAMAPPDFSEVDLAGVNLGGVHLTMPVAGLNLVVNEAEPNGPDEKTAPDWIELKNLGAAAADLSGYKVRDNGAAPMALPPGTMIPAGGYLVILCDDLPLGFANGFLHVPFKLSGGSGDEFHVEDQAGQQVAFASWKANEVPDGKTWARIPDGTGSFQVATPTRGAANRP